jgi:hypothetical protein
MVRDSQVLRGAPARPTAPAQPNRPAAPPARPVVAPASAAPAAAVGADALQAATAAAGAQALADPTWRERLGRARDDRETLRVLAEMSLVQGRPDRSADLYGALLSADRSDGDALEGVVLSQIRCGQHAAAASALTSIWVG